MSEKKTTETTQYLSFKLDEEIYAVEISTVREVLDFTKVTKVPRTPEFMRGVINLRGNVTPVVDMRLKFGMTATEKTINTCIVIVEIKLDGETTVFGVLADSVQEVFNLDSVNIEPPPKLGTRLNTDFLKGMGKRNDEFNLILDLNKVFSADELIVAKGMSDQEPDMEEEAEVEAKVPAEEAIAEV